MKTKDKKVVSEPKKVVNEPKKAIAGLEELVNEPKKLAVEPEKLVLEPKDIIAEPEKSKRWIVCPKCNGSGVISSFAKTHTSNYWVNTSTVPQVCKNCGGTGKVEETL
jgi:DnaJ-class molecular chaperone